MGGPSVVDGHRAWIIMCGCFVINMLTVGYIRSFGMLFVEIQKEFASTAVVTSAMLGVSSAVLSISAFLAHNVLLEFVSERVVVVLGGIFVSAGVVLCSLAPNIAFLIFSKGVVEGIGHAFVYGPGFVMLGKYFDRRRPLATAIANSGVSVGAMTLPFLIRFLLDVYGVRGTLLLLGAILLHTVAAGALYRPLSLDKVQKAQQASQALLQEECQGSPVEVKEVPTFKVAPLQNPIVLNLKKEEPTYSVSLEFLRGGSVENLKGHGPLSRSLGDLKGLHLRSAFELRPEYASLASIAVLSDPDTESLKSATKFRRIMNHISDLLDISLFNQPLFVVILVYCFFGIIGNSFTAIFLPPLAVEKGMSEGQVSLMLMLTGALSIVGRLGVGVLANLRLVPAHYIAAASFMLLGVACQLTRLYVSFPLLVLFSVLYGLLEGAYFALLPIIIIDFLGLQNLAKTFGFVQLVHGAACSAVYPLIGSLRDTSGSYDTSFNVIGACAMLGFFSLLLELVFRKRWHRATEKPKLSEENGA